MAEVAQVSGNVGHWPGSCCRYGGVAAGVFGLAVVVVVMRQVRWWWCRCAGDSASVAVACVIVFLYPECRVLLFQMWCYCWRCTVQVWWCCCWCSEGAAASVVSSSELKCRCYKYVVSLRQTKEII